MHSTQQAFLAHCMALLLFFVDIAIANMYQEPCSFVLLSFFIILTCYAPRSSYLLLPALFLLLQSHLYYDCIYVPLFYLIPLTLVHMYLRTLIYTPHWLAPLILMSCLTAQLCGTEWVWAGTLPIAAYTSHKIIVNMVLTWCFSLTYTMQGKLGNRLL